MLSAAALCHTIAVAADIEVSVAALTLPDESTGAVHWRSTNQATEPLQLSIRYFSERVSLESNLIEFYAEPMDPETGEAGPEPMLRMRIPEGQRLVYIVLSSDEGEDGNPRWRGNMLSANDWRAGSLKVFNSRDTPLGIVAEDRNLRIDPGGSADLHARDFDREGFPVRIYQLEPERRAVFSSTWRIAEGRRELLFIGNNRGRVTMRSLLELQAGGER